MIDIYISLDKKYICYDMISNNIHILQTWYFKIANLMRYIMLYYIYILICEMNKK